MTREIKRLIYLLSMVGSIYIWILLFSPISLFADAIVDDGMFIIVAEKILRLNWLGPAHPFNQSKVPGYPLLIAASSLLGWSIAFFHSLVHVVAAGFASILALRISKNIYLSFIVFSAILLVPTFYTSEGLRVVRDVVYVHFILISGSAFGLICFGEFSNRIKNFLLVTSAITLSIVWLLREEGVWLFPIFIIIVALIMVRLNYARKNLLSFFQKIVIFSICFSVPILVVAGLNQYFYGFFGAAGQKEYQFQRALAALYSIKVDKVEHIAIPRAAREAAYEVSPTFQSIKNGIDPGPVSTWQSGCEPYPSTCGDIATGWFIWALRTSVAEKGAYTDGSYITVYRKIADEIERACKARSLVCEQPPFSFLPRISLSDLKKLPASFWKATKAAHQRFFVVTAGPSSGDERTVNFALNILNRPLVSPVSNIAGASISIKGWFKPGNKWFSVTDGKTSENDSSDRNIIIKRNASPDLVSYFNDKTLSNQRFEIIINCTKECTLIINYDSINFIVPVDITASTPVKLGPYVQEDAVFFLDSAYVLDPNYASAANDFRVNAASLLRTFGVKLYAVILPVLTILGLLCLGLIYLKILRHPKQFLYEASPFELLALICFIAAVARVLLVSVLDSFLFGPVAINQLYLSPATFFFVLSYISAIYSVLLPLMSGGVHSFKDLLSG